MPRTIIDLADAYRTYDLGRVQVHALAGASLRVDEGEFVAVIGPSGSGKSTPMNILGCLDRPTSGTYVLGGTPVEELELSVRSSNCLKNANIKTIGDLTKKTEDDIAKTRNFGKKSLQEIKDKLKEWNLELGMSDYGPLRSYLKLSMQKEEPNEP